MNIVYIVQYYPPHTGGLEKVAHKQAQSAVTAGHSVSVVTFALPDAPAGTSVEGGVTVHRVRGNHFFDTHFGIPFCIGGVDLWRTIMREVRGADVVHMHDVFYMTSHVGYLATRRFNKPLLLTQHVAMVTHPSTIVTFVEKLVYGVWGKAIFRASQKVIVYQRVVRDFVMRQGVAKERIMEAQNGVELDLFSPITHEEKVARRKKLGLPTDRTLVLFVGRLVPKKGYRELFEARDPAYDIVFVGPGAVPDAWRTTPGVHFLGSKTQAEVAYLLPAVDIFAGPSTGEMFTLVMQEAFACGIPTVIADAPEYEAYALDRSLLTLCAPTPEALKTQLLRVAGDATLQSRMSLYVRRFAEENFDWDKNVQPTLDLYTAIEHHEH